MLSILAPKLYVDSIFCIDLDRLLKRGIRGLIFDLDNTLVRWGTSDISDELLDFIEMSKELGFELCILSNNFKERSRKIAKALGIKAIGGALKPSRRGFLRAVALMGLELGQVAVVGDQVFTDILGGNRAGLFTILVRPLWEREFISTRALRHVERRVLEKMERSGRLSDTI